MIGETIGNFRITSRLGAGGMGEVFLAEQKNIETKVAIKVLRPEISVDRQHVDRFFNEARAVSRIKHAGTVKIFDVGFHSTGHAYLVMEFLEGEALSTRIQRIGRLPVAQLCDIGKQACGVLEATHSAGITHRDLKPDNIFIVSDSELASGERVKILDFGIAKLTGTTAAGGPRTVGTMGTPAYMAPEQWGDAAKVDWRADIYSLGCVMFEMATGRPPFIAENFAQACGMHLSQEPPKLRSVAGDAPEALETMIDAMLAKSPFSRPPLRDIAKQLAQLAEQPHPTYAPSPIVAPPVAPTMAADAPTHAPLVHSPTPVHQQTPQHPQPASSSPFPQVPPTVAIERARPTTSAPSATEPPTKSKTGLYAIAGLVVVGGGIAIVAASSGGGGGGKTQVVTTPADAAVVATPPDAAVVVEAVDAAAPEPPKPAWTQPELVDVNGARVMPIQVTRAQYKEYLSSLSGADLPRATPLREWSDDRPAEPVGWVTFEQAQRFCKAMGASLLSTETWRRAAKGSWKIGDAKVVFRDWTATVTSDGLAVALGGTSKMTDHGARMAAVTNPLSKPTEASAGPSPTPESVASATIGIRCGHDLAGAGSSATSSPASPCDSATNDRAQNTADDLLAKGNYAEALLVYEALAPCRPAVVKHIYVAACRAREFQRAKAAYARLGEKAAVPTVSLGTPQASGDLDKAIIRRVIAQHLPQIRRCYESQLPRKPGLAGTVQTQFFITPNGVVSTAAASGVDPAVASCIASVIKTIEFPKPRGGGGVQVNYPFALHSESQQDSLAQVCLKEGFDPRR